MTTQTQTAGNSGESAPELVLPEPPPQGGGDPAAPTTSAGGWTLEELEKGTGEELQLPDPSDPHGWGR